MIDRATQERWNNRYSDTQGPLPGVRVVTENLHLLPRNGTALDLACGLGGNSVLLAQQGLTTYAWDISTVAVDKLNALAAEHQLSIIAEARDLIQQPPEPARFDVIVCTHFLERRLTQAIIAALRPGGLLFYQTFTRLRLRDVGPEKEEWRLADGELLTMFAPLVPVVYREERWLGDMDRGLRDEALLIAWKQA